MAPGPRPRQNARPLRPAAGACLDPTGSESRHEALDTHDPRRVAPGVTGAMHVVPLTAADASAYRALMLLAYEQAADAFTSTPEERAAEPDAWWVRRIAAPDGAGLAFGAFHEGRLVGTVAVEYSAKPKTRHKAHLIGMFVREECRGLGAGRALVEAAIAHARSRGHVRSMVLTVTDGNAPAGRLYEACGFEAFGTEPMAIRTPAGFLAKVHMWRQLDAEAGPVSVRPMGCP
jgi:GNAT superfamily N-acetyltransferase